VFLCTFRGSLFLLLLFSEPAPLSAVGSVDRHAYGGGKGKKTAAVPGNSQYHMKL